MHAYRCKQETGSLGDTGSECEGVLASLFGFATRPRSLGHTGVHAMRVNRGGICVHACVCVCVCLCVCHVSTAHLRRVSDGHGHAGGMERVFHAGSGASTADACAPRVRNHEAPARSPPASGVVVVSRSFWVFIQWVYLTLCCITISCCVSLNALACYSRCPDISFFSTPLSKPHEAHNHNTTA